MLRHDIPWQHAVYTRRNQRESFTFSHACQAVVSKTFIPNLKVGSLAEMQAVNHSNLQAMRDSPVLILVTGKWAVLVSIEAYMQHKGCLEKLPLVMHTPTLPESTAFADCSEIGKDYKILRYSSTLASYECHPAHDWTLSSVVPMLSDMVIIPMKLDERSLRPIMSSFCRASRKCLCDSLILAGGERCKEVAVVQK
jgi:hypothetical protein